MKNSLPGLPCFIAFFLLISCGKKEEITAPGLDPIQTYPIVVTTTSFRYVLHEGMNREQGTLIGDSLQANYQRIMQHLRITSMPLVTIAVWSRDHSDDFYNEMRSRIGQVYAGATGYTPGSSEMCLLWDASTPTSAVHEYAHLVSIALQRNIGNNPRWLWEAIAQHESRMFDPPSTWSPSDRTFPGFAALNQYSSPLPYRWGYFIVSFVIDRWGDDAYINLITSNGDIASTLGISEEEFGARLETYVQGL